MIKPAATMAPADGHNKSGCSTALFSGSKMPIPPQAANACTLTFRKKLSTTAATTSNEMINNKKLKLVENRSLKKIKMP
jgi:hypothetical protein